MHFKRWITSIIGLPVLILLIAKGTPLLFSIFIGIICVIGLWEYFKIVLNNRPQAIHNFIILISFIIGPLILASAHQKSNELILALIILNLISVGFISLYQFKADPFTPEIITKQVLGIIYLPLFLSYIILLRNNSSGIIWIFFLLTIIFSGDVAAFYVGSNFGKHKLCPSVSPGKTIEGAVGGIAANIIIGSLLKWYLTLSGDWIIFILFLIIVGITGQIGDLFESELKRASKIKDSGVILPGHGGILDRIDALLFAAPVAYFFKEYIL